jgi:hypothetical protein
MPPYQPLNANQRDAVEYLAEKQGCVCVECGSSDHFESGGEARHFIGGFYVDLFCTNEVHPAKIPALGKRFSLTNDQARRLGLDDVPPDP